MGSWTLVGRRDFTKKDTGEDVAMFYFQREADGVLGVECDTVYASGRVKATLPNLKIGDICIVSYNRQGFLDTIIPIPTK